MAVRQIRPIPIFMDNDVPESVGAAFEGAGHNVTRLRECMADNTPDQVVDAACRAGGLVLVTCNVKDFRRIAKETSGVSLTRRQVNELFRIDLKCNQWDAAKRVVEEMDFIALGWERFLSKPEFAMYVTIGNNFVRLERGVEMVGVRRAAAAEAGRATR